MISASLRFSRSSIFATCSSVSFCTRPSAARSSSSPTSPFSHELLEVLDRVAADVPDRDAALLGHVPHELDELLAPLLGELRDRQADELAVVRRRQAEIGLLDRLLDLLDRRRVERLDRQHARLGRVDRREVLERRRRAVVVDRDAVEQRRRRAAGAHGVEVLVRRLDRLVHPLSGIAEKIVDQRAPPSGVESVQRRCPGARPRRRGRCCRARARRRGSEGDCPCRARAPSCPSPSGPARSPAGGSAPGSAWRRDSTRGSPSRTPSTPFFAIRIASAPISSARSAAAVSVVKYGLPVPAAKMTMRPFSRWRTARRRMYGSATSCTSIADSTRVSRPVPLERLLDREGVEDGREHAHVVAGRAVHALRGRGHAAVDVAAADHERELEAVRAHLDELARERVDRLLRRARTRASPSGPRPTASAGRA